jgi:putative metallohydrolase (TIGR04338 family)
VPDPQRERLYAAEAEALAEVGPRFTRWDELVAWVDSVTTDPRWIDGFHDAPIAVEVVRRTSSARYSVAEPEAGAIHIRAGSWDAPTVLHELAHLAVGAVDEPHGARFCGVLLDLVRMWCGVDAWAALRTELRSRSVMFDER